MAIAFIEPRAFLIVRDMWQFRHLTGQRCHVLAQLSPEGVGVAPVHISLSVIVGKYRGVDIIPVALVPYQRFAKGILEGTIRRVGLEHPDAMSVQRGIEVVLAVALHGLDGPGTILTTAPGEVLQRGDSAMLGPVHHVGSTPQQPVVHKETGRALLVLIRDILW